MEKKELIEMLNRDMADEHAAIIRYLVHSYLEGEDSPLGAGLLSRAREEMWHMHWLGMIVGKLGGEPGMTPAPYPHDPTNRATIFQSYVDYEKKLVPHYHGEAEKVDDPHIKRVLHREAWESEMHAKKFQKVLGKLSEEEARGLPGEESELPPEFVEKLQDMVQQKYTQMLQSLRDAWVFQNEEIRGWQVMDFSMTNMKQLAHLAEEVAENGIAPRLESNPLVLSTAIGAALKTILENVRRTQKGHQGLKDDPEAQKHSGLMTNLDLSIDQEQYEAEEIEDWLKSGGK
ncbi:MAG: ferritin-like domain-containing protein [Desulfobacterales bacterium]|nr:ferritin-like domain-containing protein [Desulfobacterales bacterium]MCF8079800.1 ferritin-like domain-containing protein [Desulfobacterales bacterium]